MPNTFSESSMINPAQVYTPREVAVFAKCSQGFVRKQIREGRLPAFRLGDSKLLRIKGIDATQWLTKSQVIGSADSAEHLENFPRDNGAPFGVAKRTAADLALASVLSETRG
jgi:excisionase family DNA binding protein